MMTFNGNIKFINIFIRYLIFKIITNEAFLSLSWLAGIASRKRIPSTLDLMDRGIFHITYSDHFSLGLDWLIRYMPPHRALKTPALWVYFRQPPA